MVKQKENLFEYLGRKQKENKKKGEDFRNKYWKLSPIERIDYDNKRERIEKDNHWFLNITIIMVRFLVFIAILGLLFFFLADTPKQLYVLKIVWTSVGLVSEMIGNLIFGFIVCDVLAMFMLGLSRNQKIRELNKRFKLCQFEEYFN